MTVHTIVLLLLITGVKISSTTSTEASTGTPETEATTGEGTTETGADATTTEPGATATEDEATTTEDNAIPSTTESDGNGLAAMKCGLTTFVIALLTAGLFN